jgi:hypothetical protein
MDVAAAAAHLISKLIDEHDGASAFIGIGRNLTQCYTHQTRLRANLQQQQQQAAHGSIRAHHNLH